MTKTLFFGSDEGKVHAIDPSDMDTRWESSDVGGDIESGLVVYDDLVYAGSWLGLHCFNADGSGLEWEITSHAVLNGVCVYDGNVFFQMGDKSPAGHSFISADAKTGDINWQYNISGNDSHSGLCVRGGKVFATTWENKVYCLDAYSGKLEWSKTLDGTSDAIFRCPVYNDGVLYVCSNDDSVYAINPGDGSTIWEVTTAGDAYTSPLVTDNYIYYTAWSGEGIRCINASDGTEVWKGTSPSNPKASPIFHRDRVYVADDNGDLYCYSAYNSGSASEEWKTTVNDSVIGAPTAYNGYIYVGSDSNELFKIRWDNGNKSGSVTLTKSVNSCPTIYDSEVGSSVCARVAYEVNGHITPYNYPYNYTV